MRLVGQVALVLLSLGVVGYAVGVYGFLPLGAKLHPDMRATYEAHRVGIYAHVFAAAFALAKTGDTVEVWNDRGKCVVPVYVTERLMPGVAVLFEGAWMDIDKNGVDRAGNPDFLTLDEPSPAGAFAYNNAMVQIKKTNLVHRPVWDELAIARSSVFRRDM